MQYEETFNAIDNILRNEAGCSTELDCDLSVKNPNKVEEKDERTPAEIFDSIQDLSDKSLDIVNELLEWDLWPMDNDDLFADPIDDDDDDYVDADYKALSDDDKQKIDALDEQIEALENKLREVRKPIKEQIDALLEKKEAIYKKNRK